MESLHGTQGTGEHRVACSFVFTMSIKSAWGGSTEWSGCLTQSTQPDNNHKMNLSWLLEEFKTEIITKIFKCSAWQTCYLHYFCKITSKFESLTTIWFGQQFLPILILPEVFFFPCQTSAWFKLNFVMPYLGFWEEPEVLTLRASTGLLRYRDCAQGKSSMRGQDKCRTPADKPISLTQYFTFTFLSCSLNAHSWKRTYW